MGRSVGQLNAFVVGERLEELAAEVVATLAPVEREVICADQRWYLLHITPYKTLDHAIKGAVISLLDIESRRGTPGPVRDVGQYADTYLGVVDQPLAITDSGIRVLWVNAAFETAFKLTREEVLGVSFEEIGSRQFKDLKFTALVERLVATGASFRGATVRVPSPAGGDRTVRASGTRIPPIAGEAVLLLLSFAIEGRGAKT